MAFTTLLLPQPCPAAFGAGMRSFDTLGELYLGGYTEEARGTKREADDADTNVAPGLGGDKKRRKKAQVLEWDEEMRDAMPPVAAMRVLAPARKRKSPGDEDEDGEEKAVRNVKARRAAASSPNPVSPAPVSPPPIVQVLTRRRREEAQKARVCREARRVRFPLPCVSRVLDAVEDVLAVVFSCLSIG